MACFTSSGLAAGWRDQSRAATPDTCGVDIDVPLYDA
jgi:hypothetical protein